MRNAAAAAANRVQVKATPANFRFRDAMPANLRSYGSLNPPPLPFVMEHDTVPSSSSMVPATNPRKSFRDDIRDDLAAFHIASTPDKVLATPAVARAGPVQPSKSAANDGFIPPSSPIMSRKSATISQRHLVIPEEDEPEPSSPVLPRLFETPIKQKPSSTVFAHDPFTSTPPAPPRARPVVFATPAKKATPSISAPVIPAAAEVKQEITAPNDTTDNSAPAMSLYQQMGWDDDFDALIS